MKNHQLFNAEFVVPLTDIIDSKMTEQQWNEIVMNALVNDMVDTVVKAENLHVLTWTQDPISGGNRFRLSLVLINPSKYRKLEKIIEQTDLIVIDENGEKIRLRDLL